MSDIDFVRDGKVGDEVFHPLYGNGEITSTSGTGYYPVACLFTAGERAIIFTPCGKIYKVDMHSLLCWGHVKGSWGIDQGSPPKREPVEPPRLQFKGVPVWAYVGAYDSEGRERRKRMVIACVEGGVLAISNGNSCFESLSSTIWSYAWEITDD